MKIKTSELVGPALDWAVAKCNGTALVLAPFTGAKNFVMVGQNGGATSYTYEPSKSWAQGGPIIERGKINVVRCNDMYFPKGNEFGDYYEQLWRAEPYDMDSISQRFYGPTPLIAAMRCYVYSEIGNEVEIPEELS